MQLQISLDLLFVFTSMGRTDNSQFKSNLAFHFV